MSIIQLRKAPIPENYIGPIPEQWETEYGDFARWAGSFNTETAEFYIEAEHSTDRLWLTPSGTWVLTTKGYDCYISELDARAWLVREGRNDIVDQYIDIQRTAAGRPSIGPEIKFRVPVAARDALDRMADDVGIDRAELLRRIVLDNVALL